MTHPTINYQYNENEIYHIEAKKAFHKNNSEARFYEVSAKGDLGEIVSKELEIDEEGNRLIFSDNPVLILKQHN